MVGPPNLTTLKLKNCAPTIIYRPSSFEGVSHGVNQVQNEQDLALERPQESAHLGDPFVNFKF